MNKKNNNRGFTLIELLVVVVIIGILCAITLPNFAKVKDTAREASVKSNMRTTQMACESYIVDQNGAYPSSVDSFASFFPGSTTDKIINPYTNAKNAIEDGITPAAGNVSFTSNNNGYTIYGADVNGEFIKDGSSGAAFTLTSM
jgi:type IV pilus assembly protein PilA